MPSAYKGKSRHIKDAIITMLQGIKYDPTGAGTNEDAFVSVVDNTHDSLEGYPSVRLLPNNLSSVTGDNVDMDHTVSFSAIIYWPLEDATVIESDLYNQMYDLTDLIVDTIESGDNAGALSTIDPTIQSWMMNVTDTYWKAGEGKGGARLICSVNISVSYSKEVD